MANLLARWRKASPVDDGGDREGAKPNRSPVVIKSSRQSCLILGGLTGFSLLTSIGIYAWQSGQLGEIQQQLVSKQARIANSEKIAREHTDVEQANANTRGELQDLETSVTQGEYVPTLLHQTADLARETKLKVNSLRPTLEPAPLPPLDVEAAKAFKPQPYDKIHIEMELVGRYWDVAQLLYRLTKFPKILTVESVQMTPPVTVVGGTHDILTTKLKLTGFIFKLDGLPVKPAAAPLTPAGSRSLSIAVPETAAMPSTATAVAPAGTSVAPAGISTAPVKASASSPGAWRTAGK